MYKRQLGDSVSENTLLFDVDQEDLKEKIAEQELAIKKLEMSNEQARQQKELDAQKDLLNQNRSLEDYALADTEENRKIEQMCIRDRSVIMREWAMTIMTRWKRKIIRF